MTAKELGLPERDWYTIEEEKNDKGRIVRRRVERSVGTREVSLLEQRAGRDAARPAAARRRRPAAVRGGRHSARRARLPRRRDRVAAPRPVAARQARADVRAHRRARHQPRRPLQARPREQRGLGDDARSRQAGRRRRGRRQRLQRQAALERPQRRQGAGGRRRARSTPSREHCAADSGYFVSARKADERGGATDVAFVFSSWQKGIESWRFNVPTERGAEPDLRASTVFDRTLLSRRRDGLDEAFRAHRDLAPAWRRCRPIGCRRGVKIVHQGSGQEIVLPLDLDRRRPQRADDLEHPARGQARRLRGRRSSATAAAGTPSAATSEEGAARAHLDERQLPRRGVPPAADRCARERAEGAAGRRDAASPSTCR